MSNGKKSWLWVTLIGFFVVAGILGILYLYRRKPLTLMGAITAQDEDFHKEQPISNVDVTVADGLATSAAKSDHLGFFAIPLLKDIRRSHPVTLQFRHPNYEPFDLKDTVSDKLYIVHLTPIAKKTDAAPSKKPPVVIGNLRATYSMKSVQSVNVGSAVKTFEVANIGNVPCKHAPVCSPDGRWKASVGSVTLDAGGGNEFHDARLTCIAGPCPFTRINGDEFSRVSQKITASVLNWSDTTTFLLEAEVSHTMNSDVDYQTYPVIFGAAFSFTMPARAEGLSLEADVTGETVIYPLGPELLLSWATCNAGNNRNENRVYRCELKPGYRFQ
jgi:hypothetical protein